MLKIGNTASVSGQGLLLGLIAISAAALTYLQTANFPFVPFTDAICFLPQAVKFAQGDGLRNVYQFDYLPDGAFIWHGFLFPLILGGLFKTDTYTKVSVVLAVMNAFTVLVLAAALLRLTSQWRIAPRAAFLSVCLLAQAGFLLGMLGRPETLSSLLIAAGLLAWTFKSSWLVYAAIGVILGLLAVTSPVPAVSAALCLLIGMVIREGLSSSLVKAGVLVSAVALLATVVAFQFYPYSFGQWLWGMEQHAKSVIKRGSEWTDVSWLLRQYVISSGRLMMGGVFAGALAAAGYLIWTQASLTRLLRVALVAFLAVFAVIIVRFSIVSGFYVMLSLFPLGAGVIFSLLNVHRAADAWRVSLLKFCTVLFLAIASLDPLLLQTGRAMGFSGMPLTEARRLFEQDMAEMPGRIAVSMDLAVLSDSTERLQVLYGYVPPCVEPDTDWLVAQQFCYFYNVPPAYQNFTLVKNRFVDKQKFPGRLSQWFGVNGYGYAVYRRINGAE